MSQRTALIGGVSVLLLGACNDLPATPESICAKQRECFEWTEAREADCVSSYEQPAMPPNGACDQALQRFYDCMEDEACTEVGSCHGAWCPDGVNESHPCDSLIVDYAECVGASFY